VLSCRAHHGRPLPASHAHQLAVSLPTGRQRAPSHRQTDRQRGRKETDRRTGRVVVGRQGRAGQGRARQDRQAGRQAGRQDRQDRQGVSLLCWPSIHPSVRTWRQKVALPAVVNLIPPALLLHQIRPHRIPHFAQSLLPRWHPQCAVRRRRKRGDLFPPAPSPDSTRFPYSFMQNQAPG
jgi:hypothetical protein